MTMDHQALWDRLLALDINPPGAIRTFEMRLAEQQGWTVDYALRVVFEYRRFVFLSATTGFSCTPSLMVDEAWHLHLTYSRSYWDVMCRQILRSELHHEPGFGRPGEADGHRDAFERTLKAYQDAFGEEPPADIWRVREAPAHAIARPKESKPKFREWRWPLLAGLALFIAGCVDSQSGASGAVMIVPVILMFFGCSFVVLAIVAIARAVSGRGGQTTYIDGVSTCDSVVIVESPTIIAVDHSSCGSNDANSGGSSCSSGGDSGGSSCGGSSSCGGGGCSS